MNALNATWDLCLNKPYSDGGYENSTRVFGDRGFDMQPPLKCGTYVNGTVRGVDLLCRVFYAGVFVCVCVCMCAHVCACVCACVRVCVCVCRP